MTDLDLLCRETVESAHMPRVMVGRFTKSQAKPEEAVGGKPASAVDAGSRPVAGRSATATSERKDVTAGRDPQPNIAGPQVAAVSGGEPSIPSPDADGAKMETVSAAPGRPCCEQECTSVKSGRAANNRWASIRPHCQNPDMCPGYGDKHCSACRKLMKTSEAA